MEEKFTSMILVYFQERVSTPMTAFGNESNLFLSMKLEKAFMEEVNCTDFHRSKNTSMLFPL